MADRLVTKLPLSTLWDDEGRDTPSEVETPVGSDQIRELLREEPDLTLIVANVGDPLRRIQGDSRFAIWKEELLPHLVEPRDSEAIHLDAYQDGLAYTAFLGRDRDRPVIVFQAHH